MRTDALFALVPWPWRLAALGGLVLVIVLLGWRLNGALEAHYTAEQNTLVAEDAARSNAAALAVEEGRNAALRLQLAKREARKGARTRTNKEHDDGIDALKASSEEVRRWADEPVPAAVAARINGLR